MLLLSDIMDILKNESDYIIELIIPGLSFPLSGSRSSDEIAHYLYNRVSMFFYGCNKLIAILPDSDV